MRTIMPQTLPQPAPSVEALRAGDSTARGRRADDLAAVLDALARPVPAFLASAPGPDAEPHELAPADDLLGSCVWPDEAGVEAIVGRLHAFLATAESVALFSLVNGGPELFFEAPCLGFSAGDTPAAVVCAAEMARRPRMPDTPEGFARYRCELTEVAFTLPIGAPVPALFFSTPRAGHVEAFEVAKRSAQHPDEYAEAEDDEGRHGFIVHPSLVEAGPAHVLRAAWLRVERSVIHQLDLLRETCDLAAALAGVEPEALGVEWPSRAYRGWKRVERADEPTTWRRELAGVGPA